MNTSLNRTMVALLTNQSGGSVAQGDVVVVDSANASSFTTNTAGAYVSGSIGVVLEPNGIAAAATGTVALGGWVPKVTLSGAASLGDVFTSHTVAKQAVRHAAPVVAGDFGEVLGTGTSPAAYLWGAPTQGGGGGSSTLAGDTDVSIASPASGDHLVYNGTAWANKALLATASAVLSTDVTMTNANQFYDGPSISLGAGTWIVGGVVLASNGSVTDFTAKLWDGTTVFGSGQGRNVAGTLPLQLAFPGCIVSPSTTTTYKLSVAGDNTSGAIKAACTINGVGNNATAIFALKVG